MFVCPGSVHIPLLNPLLPLTYQGLSILLVPWEFVYPYTLISPLSYSYNSETEPPPFSPPNNSLSIPPWIHSSYFYSSSKGMENNEKQKNMCICSHTPPLSNICPILQSQTSPTPPHVLPSCLSAIYPLFLYQN